ncbi:unnamed protein product [Pleuronectes platessa]|uniref:Uncharacterized protein n=1 Tax=Pleuronectes platessa TaxID=8262 RepID=A0A9N7UHM1_PLEPL|nr:unnamed protein product [Pleuronectes platessa]
MRPRHQQQEQEWRGGGFTGTAHSAPRRQRMDPIKTDCVFSSKRRGSEEDNGRCCIEWMMESMQAAGAESREPEMDDIADYQQAEASNIPPVEMNEENPWPRLRRQFAFKRKRSNSYMMLCNLCLPVRTFCL